MKKGIAFCLLMLCLTVVSYGTEQKGSPSSQKERCPVCGMFVSMFADSTRAIFDGSKDMFKYYLDMGRYNPSKSEDPITAILVKDYYSQSSFNALKAYYVIWSDVYGPMGRGLGLSNFLPQNGFTNQEVHFR